jgi:apolipoprotein N-acyltransferase
VDPLGRVIRFLPLGAEGILDAPLPKPIEPTVYVRAGDSVVGLALAAAFLIVLRRRNRG